MLSLIIVGFLVGIVAKFFMPGRDPGGVIVTTLLGILGAVVAGYLGRSLGWYQFGEPVGFLGAVVGAMILLLGYRVVTGKKV